MREGNVEGRQVQGSMYDGVLVVAAWRIRLNRPCAAAMRLFRQIILITCFRLSPPLVVSQDQFDVDIL